MGSKLLILTFFVLSCISVCSCRLSTHLSNDLAANKTKAIEVVEAYARHLNNHDCVSWVNLFAEDGIKYDEPEPSVGHKGLKAFCEGIYEELPSFFYTLTETPLVTSSKGLRVLSKWLIGAADKNGKPLGQTGIGSYIINNDFKIQECTGYDDIPLPQ
ncbi:integration host factor subunit alpha [Acrasis kona]|uniref:Integration host factor subunit alpha n=1 Tax=Acrasis kona TaxID=1008807 RepID=A0AAW2ZSN8_9EUKA